MESSKASSKMSTTKDEACVDDIADDVGAWSVHELFDITCTCLILRAAFEVARFLNVGLKNCGRIAY